VLIDDDEDAHVLVKYALERAGFKLPLRRFFSGEEALPYLEDCTLGRAALPHVIILDLKMPGMSGFDVLAWLRTRGILEQTKVAVVSCCDHAADVMRAYSLGAHACIGKAPNSDILAKLITDAIYGPPADRAHAS